MAQHIGSLTRQTVNLDGITITGIENEYVFSEISRTKNYYESEILNKWLPQFVNSRQLIDIGANLGNHTVFFSKKGKAKQILAIEPYPENFDLLKHNVAVNKLKAVTCLNLAAGAQEGFAIFKNTIANNLGAVSVTITSKSQAQSVPVVPLDNLGESKDLHPDFIKIDVEGAELSVLKGMTGIVNQFKPKIWVEVSLDSVKHVLDYFHKAGYVLADLIAFNMLFVYSPRGSRSNSVTVLAEKYLSAIKDAWAYRNWSIKDNEQKTHLETQLAKTVQAMEVALKTERELTGLLSEKTAEIAKAHSQLKERQQKGTKLEAAIADLNSNLKEQQQKVAGLENELKKSFDAILKLQETMDKLNADHAQELSKRDTFEKTAEAESRQYKLQAEKQVANLQSELDTRKAANEKLTRELTAIKSRRLYKIVNKWWRVATASRFYSKKLIYTTAFKIYKRTEGHYRLNTFLRRANNRLGIIKDYKAALRIVLKDKPQQLKQSKPTEKIVATKTLRPLKKIRVAAVVDEFTYDSFKFECELIELTPDNWRQKLETTAPDLFFCESAWSGVDSKARPWKGQIYSSINFKNENRQKLLEILAYCKEKAIPTVFWNKEDPTFFGDKVHNFLDTASRFDFIFTTAAECVPEYIKLVGHDRVYPLLFAAQPKLFNPIEKYERTDEIIFAGSWYKQHPKRSREMEEILDAIIKSGYKLKIFDRYSGDSDPNHFFPDKYKAYIHPALKYEELDLAYKGSKYALNINTVTQSPTMFARRVFELMASNTYVISNYSRGIAELFGSNVTITRAGRFRLENVDNKRSWCLDEVLKKHTYQNRLCTILDNVGIPYQKPSANIAVYLPVADQAEIKPALEKIRPVSDWIAKIYLLLDKNIAPLEIPKLYREYNSSLVEVLSADYILKYGAGKLEPAGDYFVFATTEMNPELLRKAPLHFQYLDNGISCYWETDVAKKFRIQARTGMINTVIPISHLEEVFSAYIKSEELELTNYGIN